MPLAAVGCRRVGPRSQSRGRLAWPLFKEDTQIREAFHVFNRPTDIEYKLVVTKGEREAERDKLSV